MVVRGKIVAVAHTIDACASHWRLIELAVPAKLEVALAARLAEAALHILVLVLVAELTAFIAQALELEDSFSHDLLLIIEEVLQMELGQRREGMPRQDLCAGQAEDSRGFHFD